MESIEEEEPYDNDEFSSDEDLSTDRYGQIAHLTDEFDEERFCSDKMVKQEPEDHQVKHEASETPDLTNDTPYMRPASTQNRATTMRCPVGTPQYAETILADSTRPSWILCACDALEDLYSRPFATLTTVPGARLTTNNTPHAEEVPDVLKDRYSRHNPDGLISLGVGNVAQMSGLYENCHDSSSRGQIQIEG
ncbi:hypothetical protein PG984_002695 [Apiospora sp. TS-2023a]